MKATWPVIFAVGCMPRLEENKPPPAIVPVGCAIRKNIDIKKNLWNSTQIKNVNNNSHRRNKLEKFGIQTSAW